MSMFTVYTDKQNEFRWKFTAANNAVIAKSSESFKVREDCVQSVTMLQKDVAGATVTHAAPGAVQVPGPVAASGAKPGVTASPAVASKPVVTTPPAAGAKPVVVSKN